MEELYTLNEASFVLGQSVASIRKVIDAGIISPKVRKTEQGTRHDLSRRALLYLAVIETLAKDVTLNGKRRLWEVISSGGPNQRRFKLSLLELDLTAAVLRLEASLGKLDDLRSAVEFTGSNLPVLRGTSVEVYKLAHFARNKSFEDVARRSALSRQQLEDALSFVKVYPRVGTPPGEAGLEALF